MLDQILGGLLQEAISAIVWCATTQPSSPVPYDAADAFRADVLDSGAPADWLSDETVRRAIALSLEETGTEPDRGNASGHSLMRYAIIGRKVARGVALSEEERRVVDRLTAARDAA